MAYKCQKRKEKVKEKQEEEKRVKSQSYSQAANHHNNANTFPTSATALNNNQTSKMMICYLHAHAMNMVNPGTFQKTLIDILQENNLPTVILPNNPPSQQIIQNMLPSETPQIMEPVTTNLATTTSVAEADLELSSDSKEEQETDEEEDTGLPEETTQQETLRQPPPLPKLTESTSTHTVTRQHNHKQTSQTPHATNNTDTEIAQTTPSVKQRKNQLRKTRQPEPKWTKRH